MHLALIILAQVLILLSLEIVYFLGLGIMRVFVPLIHLLLVQIV